MISAGIAGCIIYPEPPNSGYRVHEWGVFQREYSSDDADALTSPAPPFVVKKPVIYFHTPRLIGNATVHLGIGPQG
ncbi:MAG: hypothetical protein PHH26_05285, partial [Candidatus Thermoplasmatota archaeon]|nr:hypothetical protein [Candidatus Thermoplasmatota archaeon]